MGSAPRNGHRELQSQDAAVAGILEKGPGAADEVRALFDRLQPTLPIVLANLVSIGEVAVAYQPSIEQLIVLLPQGTATMQAVGVANRNTKQDYEGELPERFNLNLNLPPPVHHRLSARPAAAAAQLRGLSRPARGRRLLPDAAGLAVQRARRPQPALHHRPGKRAPTVKMCESNEKYVPLNDGYNWKGDPNATLSGQIGSAATARAATCATASSAGSGAACAGAAEYDPASGTYVGPDGHVYTQADLARGATEEQTWQTMLLPPEGN